MLTGAPRILIARLSAIGDVVHGLPVLCQLRASLPHAFLAWVVEGRAADLLRGHPDLDALVVAPRRWMKSPKSVWLLRCELRALGCDTAIDLQGLTKSAFAARLSGARRRIGFAGADGREFSRLLNNQLVQATRKHVIERNLELLSPLGIAVPGHEMIDRARFGLPESAEDAIAAERILGSVFPRPSRGAQPSLEFAVINPGAGWPSKLWPTDRFAAVARWLMRHWSLPSLIVWGGDAEQRLADEIADQSQGAARVAARTSLTELAAIARRAAIFIASDTGPLHLAAAVGTPCVGLFGPMPAWRNGPYGRQHRSVQAVELTGSSRQRRTAGPESMLAISVAQACAACDGILANARNANRSRSA